MYVGVGLLVYLFVHIHIHLREEINSDNRNKIRCVLKEI